LLSRSRIPRCTPSELRAGGLRWSGRAERGLRAAVRPTCTQTREKNGRVTSSPGPFLRARAGGLRGRGAASTCLRLCARIQARSARALQSSQPTRAHDGDRLASRQSYRTHYLDPEDPRAARHPGERPDGGVRRVSRRGDHFLLLKRMAHGLGVCVYIAENQDVVVHAGRGGVGRPVSPWVVEIAEG